MNKPAPGGEADAPAALHQRIRTDIEAKILSGDLGPGDRIPFEHELTAQYGCSRMTVRMSSEGRPRAAAASITRSPERIPRVSFSLVPT